MKIRSLLVPTVCVCIAILALPAYAQQNTAGTSGETVSTDRFCADVTAFLGHQIEAHLADIKTVNPPPDRVLGALTTGEFSWGTFMRSLASYSALSGQRVIAGHDIPKLIGQIGLIESRRGGKTFAQLYGALALLTFGADLNHNPVWQSLSPSEQKEWRSLLDPSRFYDRKTHHVINLPENYFGVAARIVAMDYKLGIITDKSFVDEVIDRAARQFASGNLYSDDDIPAGRYDRYSNEYARYVYMAAELVGRTDVMKALEPTLKEQMQTWWDLLSPDGYGYPWGRSLGAISYMDTMEIVYFLGEHPQFRPAPMPQLASAYYVAWQWLSHDVIPDRHLLNVFGFGRGNYSYISKEREWQQTVGFFGKASGAHLGFERVMKAEGIQSFPAKLNLPDVNRFEFFRKGKRPAGVWLVRQPGIRFALPITSGPKPGASDYLSSPYNLLNFAPPVQQTLPVLTPFVTLSDGRTFVAGDGADEIDASPDGKSLHAVWKRWAVIGRKAGELENPGIVADVRWDLQGDSLVRTEKITSPKPIQIQRLWMVFPSTAQNETTITRNGAPIYSFISPDGTLNLAVQSSRGSLTPMLHATGNSPDGRGSRGPVPLMLDFEQRNVELAPDVPYTLTVSMTIDRDTKGTASGE